jgi:metal-responsive CopG/Arc/MetJ family transcriptional regulator
MKLKRTPEERIVTGTSISMSPAMVRELDAIAEAEGRSRSNLIVMMLREQVAEYNARKKKESSDGLQKSDQPGQ